MEIGSYTKVTRIDRFWKMTVLKLFPFSFRPNYLTVFRFFCVPFVILLLFKELYTWGLALFVLAALTDTWDGAMARTRNQITEWGKIYDPMADKLLIGSTALLVIPRLLSFTVALVIVTLELLLIAEAIYLSKFKKKAIQALPVGKIKMVMQSFGVSFLLLYLIVPFYWILSIATGLLYMSIGFAAASLVVYRTI